MQKEEIMGYQVFNRDTAKKVYEQEYQGKISIFAILEKEGHYFLLKNCILDQEPYIVVVEKDIQEIDKNSFLNILFKK